LAIPTRKQASPEANPDNQWQSGILIEKSVSLIAGLLSGKAAFSYSDKPRFREALRETILKIPSLVKCSLLITSSYACLKRRKSPLF
jgi:hypothetical protein